MLTDVQLALLGAAVFAGAVTTRLTGMGFALVASPLLVLLLGNGNGVSLIVALGLIQAPFMLALVWRDVEPKKALGLLAPAVVGLIPGAWLAARLPRPVLSIVVGSLILVGIGATVASERARVFTGTPGLLASGFLSGLMNALAGIGGPAIVLYAVSTGWAHASFVATIQLYFGGLSLATLIAKGPPTLDVIAWAVAIVALALGLLLGQALSTRVPARVARWLVIAVAVAGGVATIVKGVQGL